jgi:sulfur-carrier protein
VITVELLGVPRLRAGVAEVALEASSLGEAFVALGRACPALAPSVVDGRRLGAAYMVAVNGLQFTADPETPLRPGDVVLLLSADAGG